MNSKKISRQTIIIVSIIFIFNVVAQCLINWVQGYQPKTYQIPTNDLTMLLNYIGDYWVNYAITVVVYLFLWFAYVGLCLGAFLWLWENITWSQFCSGLLKGRVHLYAALLLILTIPLNQFGFKFPLSYYLTIPKTFLDSLNSQLALAIGVVVYILYFLLVVKMRFLIHQTVISHDRVGLSFKNSWRRSQFNLKFYRDLLLVVIVLVISLFGSIYAQHLLDSYTSVAIRHVGANVLIVVMTGIFYVITAKFVNLLADYAQPNHSKRPNQAWHWANLLILCVVSILNVWLSGKWIDQPSGRYLVIAHKGISSLNQTPNVVENLKKVSATKPDYVEMNIQPTKDDVYVLSHNTKVTTTSGKSYKINQTKWSTLKSLKIKEAGHIFKLSSFEDYLKTANLYHQKLLIELKINDTITNEQLQKFETQYGPLIQKNHSEIQSLNQNALKRASRYLKVRTGLLSPVKNTIDSTKTNQFYAIEYSAVDQTVVRTINQHKKDLYVWTVNDSADVASAYVMGVRGFITDHPKQVRQQLKQLVKQPTYSDALRGILFFQKSAI
ncbi:glycerophosphodiester phosphodiesterase [Leuconostoc pseudomesenteroides]|uniref:Glycerophosphodiester phosphodiesterase n=1 Tax=Leuconostoc pseudomesenteroides TaxID=33968 RepID=A0A1X0VEM9_LEUPS|nr:glycerophosphodiester phosphodiesterase family protein [Leuconostoc pseudomesenteroides]OQJ71662.1 glycerophosphodiester phosphodiesterase [Leuconostoc pseudomesenteroides]OQJ76324.1 glycerophosphodiester phosphodiesterase [Leuconostoc pseudomesenteroides]OQJ78455.1 glycerophosphodiester phosphodiesterase [Leuconostoc pseudomesenteroides]ORI37989.1 glycerophosphodiester phosphodiesterase [Leuconostoc pseudomesenteroides]ORI46607.1 glycerophosphodiester phosphodiesterase [Leuconostoc pseudom